MIDKLVSAFVWNNKLPKIKRGTMKGPKEKGDLDLPDYDSIRKSLLAAWTKRMINGINEGWMAIPSSYLDRIGGILIFDCNYDTNLLNLQGTVLCKSNANELRRCSFFVLANFRVKVHTNFRAMSSEKFRLQTIFPAIFRRNIARYFERSNKKSLLRKFAEA